MLSLYLFFLSVLIYLFFSVLDYSPKLVVTFQTQLSTEVFLIIWKRKTKKLRNPCRINSLLKKSSGLYVYSVIRGVKSRLRNNKNLLRYLLSSYWNTHSRINREAGSNQRNRKDSNPIWEKPELVLLCFELASAFHTFRSIKLKECDSRPQKKQQRRFTGLHISPCSCTAPSRRFMFILEWKIFKFFQKHHLFLPASLGLNYLLQ